MDEVRRSRDDWDRQEPRPPDVSCRHRLFRIGGSLALPKLAVAILGWEGEAPADLNPAWHLCSRIVSGASFGGAKGDYGDYATLPD